MGSPEAGIEASVEADLQDHAGVLGGLEDAIGVGEGERHGLLAEDRFARRC
jgi:hypothetical protein